MADAPYKLILLRHGESEWNAKNLFTGWVDVNLNEKGEKEAVRGGELLKDADLLPDVVHTSLQKRAIRTAQLALEAADRHWIPVHRSWRLNERHYGALQGLNKAETAAKHGEGQVKIWRRSYDIPPPPLEADDPRHPSRDPRYAGETKYTLPKMLRFSLDAIFSFSHRPLQLATLLGFLISSLAFIAIPVVIVLKILGSYLPGFGSITIVLLLLGGIQLITIGIVGEYRPQNRWTDAGALRHRDPELRTWAAVLLPHGGNSSGAPCF